MMEALIFGIDRLRMATDGSGVRTLVGIYGCPLRCAYCLNPHSWNNTLTPVKYTPEQLYKKISVDNLYFQATNGGITFGGGEPLLQVDFIEAFKRICPQEWRIDVETSLHVQGLDMERLSKIFDVFFIDIKTSSAEIYAQYTGGMLEIPLDNLKKLLATVGSDRVIVRVPMIPDYTTELQQQETVEYLQSIGVTQIDAFKYRRIQSK